VEPSDAPWLEIHALLQDRFARAQVAAQQMRELKERLSSTASSSSPSSIYDTKKFVHFNEVFFQICFL
jgi:hypothetical protein